MCIWGDMGVINDMWLFTNYLKVIAISHGRFEQNSDGVGQLVEIIESRDIVIHISLTIDGEFFDQILEWIV